LTYETPSRSVDATARIQVYFQGFLDDACFLYALANAYRALTGKRVTREHWSRAISQLPDPATFLGGAGATKLSHDVAEQLIEVVLGAFSGQGEIVTLKSLSPSAGIADFRDAVSSDSVVVFAYGGPTEFLHPQTHIVCGVAASNDPAALHVACSAALSSRYLQYGEYFERHHPALNRWSNDSIPVDSELVIAPNFRWQVTLADRAR